MVIPPRLLYQPDCASLWLDRRHDLVSNVNCQLLAEHTAVAEVPEIELEAF